MVHAIDFFFDFLSPFAYLAHRRLPAIADQFECELNYKPIDLQNAKAAAGNTGPSNREIPIKLRYLMTDLNRWAKRYQIPLVFPPSLASTPLNKGTFFAIDRKKPREYVGLTWRLTWGLGRSMSDEGLLKDIAGHMDWKSDVFLSFINSNEADTRYAEINREAHERGIFGVPTVMIADEMWWGNDRLDFLIEYLESLSGSK